MAGTNFEDLILRDITANRPAAGVPGRLFYDTTLSKLERDNGASYDDVAETAGGAGSDTTAIHDNAASEISAVAPKATPVSGDYLLIEDSADSNNKKRITIGTLPASGVGLVSTLMFTIDGGGSEIADGVKGDMLVDFACTINAWTLLADASGAIKVDIWRDTYANYPPTDADSLTNAHEPEIAASGVNAQDTSLGDWTSTAIVAGDILRFNVDSATTITRCLVALKVTRT